MFERVGWFCKGFGVLKIQNEQVDVQMKLGSSSKQYLKEICSDKALSSNSTEQTFQIGLNKL